MIQGLTANGEYYDIMFNKGWLHKIIQSVQAKAGTRSENCVHPDLASGNKLDHVL